ncbi:MAG: alpha/beta hydrolase [Cyanobacteria bacterium P01_D01_bin.156]
MEPLFWPKAGQIPIRNLRRQLKHTKLFWREVGRGTTVIFLHGSWCDGDQWTSVLSLMGEHYHCLAPDLIGFGESDQLPEKSAYSIAMQVNTLAELLSSLRLNSVVLVGHSLGAWIAARYALKHSEQVRGLCVFEPEGIVYEPKRWQRERWLASPLGGVWLSITQLLSHKSILQSRAAWQQKHHLRRLLKQHPAACRLLFKRSRKALEAEIIGQQLAILPIPMMVVHGQGAGTTSQYLTQKFTMATPNALVKALPGQEDLPRREANAIANCLHAWLNTI